jgi:hypothetical protein
MIVEPKAGKRTVLITRQRKKQDFAYAMRYLVDILYPDADIDVVMDNLNTHNTAVLIEVFGKVEADRITNRLCFHYTPPHGSWLNIICLRRRLADEWTLQTNVLGNAQQ